MNNEYLYVPPYMILYVYTCSTKVLSYYCRQYVDYNVEKVARTNKGIQYTYTYSRPYV